MKACVLRTPAPITSRPLEFAEVEIPTPDHDEVLMRVRACGICRTDQHVVEGDLPVLRKNVIPGFQICDTTLV